MGYFVKNRRVPSGSSSIVVPSGGSANRPTAPVFGSFRYNIDIGTLEFFNGSIFQPVSIAGQNSLSVQSELADGITTTWVLDEPIALGGEGQIMVFVGSIYQEPVVAYTITGVSGGDITFSSAPPDGSAINIVYSVSP